MRQRWHYFLLSIFCQLRVRGGFLNQPVEWTTRQGRNLCIVLHVFSSKFRAENDACNDNFIKQLLSEILTFLVGIGYEKFEFPAHKKNQSLRESNRTLKKALWGFQSSCVLCVLHCGFFPLTFVNVSIETAMTTKITLNNLASRSQRLVWDLTQVEFGFLMSETFELADAKNINI